MPLSQAKIESLYTARANQKAAQECAVKYGSKATPFFIMPDGAKVTGKVKSDLAGTFRGKQGTLRRSGKGRTYRLANGSRKYVRSWNSLSDDGTCLAYLP